MKSKPLNQNHRDTICSSIMSDTFAADNKRIWETEGDLAMECYKRLYTQSERDTLKRLGKGWFGTQGSLNVQAGPERMSVYFRHHGSQFVKSIHDCWTCHLALEATDPLAQALLKFDNEETDHKQAKRLLESKILAQLNSCRTTKQLLAAWPEVEIWLPTDLTTEHAPAPMVQVVEINKIICDKLGPKGGTCTDGK